MAYQTCRKGGYWGSSLHWTWLANLSQRGLIQAEALADAFVSQPDLIVVSSFVRAKQTAEPLIRRFPHVSVEEWPVHEYTFLAPERFENTTCGERQKEVDEYWANNDPRFVAGEGAESFVNFVSRVDAMISQILARSERFLAIVSHGYTIQALLWRLGNPSSEIDEIAMRNYGDFRDRFPIATTQVVPLTISDGTISFEALPVVDVSEWPRPQIY